MIEVPIELTGANGRTIQEFQNLIEQRMRLLNETPKKTVTACAIQVLKSLRAATKTAKTSKPVDDKGNKPQIEECAGLYYSMKKSGKGAKPVPCLRHVGSKAEFKDSNSSFVIVEKGIKASLTKIYLWTRRNGRKVYIAATSKSVAQRWMKQIEKRRIAKFKGLAKTALGKIMNKIALTGNAADNASAVVQQVAQQNAHVQKDMRKDSASVNVEDGLDYSIDALKGGEAEIENSLQKAMNKIASIINRKMKDVLEFKPIDLNLNN